MHDRGRVVCGIGRRAYTQFVGIKVVVDLVIHLLPTPKLVSEVTIAMVADLQVI